MPAVSASSIPSVGEALREFLSSKGVTQVKAAQTMGVSRGHLNEIIGGEEELSADIMLKSPLWGGAGLLDDNPPAA